jgi:hypothetical protein
MATGHRGGGNGTRTAPAWRDKDIASVNNLIDIIQGEFAQTPAGKDPVASYLNNWLFAPEHNAPGAVGRYLFDLSRGETSSAAFFDTMAHPV